MSVFMQTGIGREGRKMVGGALLSVGEDLVVGLDFFGAKMVVCILLDFLVTSLASTKLCCL